MRFQATDDTDHVEISGVNYVVDENGGFNCDNTEHQPLIRQLGFRGEADPAPVAAPIKADTPPEVPEGYLDPEAVTALVEENEDLVQGSKKLHEQLSAAATVEEQLRDRIQELEGQLASTTEGRDKALQELADERARATETATETHSEAEGGAGGGDDVNGLVVTSPEAFDAMEYQPLKDWLKANGVTVSGNITKPKAIEACKARFAELNAG